MRAAKGMQNQLAAHCLMRYVQPFEELRVLLGIKGLSSWCKQPMLRLVPCLFGLLSFVALIYAEHLKWYPCS
jgi:hypothetical protein